MEQVPPAAIFPTTEQTNVEHIGVGQGLLEAQALGVATIAVANVARFPEFYEIFRRNIGNAVEQGVLDLENKYPDEKPEERVGLYAKEIITQQLKLPASDLLAVVDPALIRNEVTIIPAQLRDLEIVIKKLEEKEKAYQKIIHELRSLRISGGASPEELEEFDRVAHLLTAPQREANEFNTAQNNLSLTEKVKNIIRPLISRKAFQAIGLTSPPSV